MECSWCNTCEEGKGLAEGKTTLLFKCEEAFCVAQNLLAFHFQELSLVEEELQTAGSSARGASSISSKEAVRVGLAIYRNMCLKMGGYNDLVGRTRPE